MSKKMIMINRSRPRLQVVQNDEIAQAIETIRKHRPGLINDSMVVTSALVEHALALDSDTFQQTNYQTPYGMTILRSGNTTYTTGIFQFLIQNFNRIAAIFAHIDNENDEFMAYISRGKKPAYTFVLKGKGFTDFEFIHIATKSGCFFEECLTLLVLDFKNHRDDIRFNLVQTAQFKETWGGEKDVSEYIPSLDEMAKAFFRDETYMFGGGGGKVSHMWNLDWEANSDPYQPFDIDDTRYVDYSHALVGLKPSSVEVKKYGVENLVRSGVLAIDRNLLDRRFRCLCNGWSEEKQDLDFYELGIIFGQHFGYDAIYSPAEFLFDIGSTPTPNATVYVEKGKRIEVLPMNWEQSWFSTNIDGVSNTSGWNLLDDDSNPFRLYDMNDFFPDALKRYKQQKKRPK